MYCCIKKYNLIIQILNLNIVLLLKSMSPTTTSTHIMWPSLHKRLDTPGLKYRIVTMATDEVFE